MDEREGFLSDLRALRARRGLSLAEIAERTRFPADTLAAVESGPALPSLPALEAYLRGCGEPLAPWEDRWRRLGQGAAPATVSGAGLPVREAGTSALAAAGAAAAEAGAGTAGGAGRAAFTIKRLGTGDGRGRRTASRRVRGRGYAVVAAGAAGLLAAGGVTLLALSNPAGHGGRAAPAPGVTGGGAGTASGSAPTRSGPPPHRRSRPPADRQARALLEVAGVGCPQGSAAGVVVANAPTGPGWTLSDGGWTGDGCDGSTVWTMDPNGTQPVPSALTWRFSLAAGVSHCTLAVFVPTQNALGVGDYAVFAGDAATGRDLATVPVSQAAAAGQWVTLGSYPVRGTSLDIQVAPAAGMPGDPGPGTHGRQHVTGLGPGHQSAIAASAAKAACD